MIDRSRCAIVKKDGGKVVVLLHDNASIHKCNIVQAAIGKVGFVELNDGAYSTDVASCHCQS